MVKKLLILAGLIIPTLLFGSPEETNSVNEVKVNSALAGPKREDGPTFRRFLNYSLKEADEKVGNAYGSSMANVGFWLSDDFVQRRAINKRGKIPFRDSALAGLGESILSNMSIGEGLKNGVFGLRDEYFEPKGMQFTSIGTFSEIISRRETRESKFTYGADLLRGDPNVYFKRDFQTLDLSLGIRASWEHAEFAAHKYLGKNWRVTCGARADYVIDNGDGRVYAALERRNVLGGTAVIVGENRFRGKGEVGELKDEGMMYKGESRIMAGWTKRF